MGVGRRTPPTQTRVERRLRAPGRKTMAGMIVVLVAATLVAVFAQRALLTQATPATPLKAKYATTINGSAFGASQTRMQNAVVAANWPQQSQLWCGVATVAAIAQYEQATSATQQSIATYLDTAPAASRWGTPSTAAGYYGPGFSADISRDFGTDPRSLAQALTAATNHPYHQAIVLSNNYEATVALADDVVNTGQPVSVFVDHALHSAVVSAIFATDNPVTDPNSITGLRVWDPAWSIPSARIQSAEYLDVSLNTWLNDPTYWGSNYDANVINGYIYDPNPAVGPYAYSNSAETRQTNLWTGHYVYIRPDAANSPMASVSADWAENQSGALIKGWDGQVPSGYSGSTSLFEAVKVTLPETSPYGIAFAARGSYDPAAAGSGPVSAVAWTGSDYQHHLNVMTSPVDGLNYNNKIIMGDTSILNPAILVAPPATAGGPNIVVIAWIGTDGGHSLNVMYDVYGQRLKLTLWHNSSAFTPALAWFHGQIWLAWTGENAAHSMNVIAMGPQGVTQGAQTILWSQPGGATAPQLVTDTANDRLLLGWSQLWSNQLMVLASSDAVNWSVPSTGPLQSASYGSPGLLALPAAPAGSAPIYLAWTTTWSQLYFWRGSNAQGWTDYQAIAESSPYATEIGYLGQGSDFVLAWCGTDSAHHLNLALILI